VSRGPQRERVFGIDEPLISPFSAMTLDPAYEDALSNGDEWYTTSNWLLRAYTKVESLNGDKVVLSADNEYTMR